MWNVDFYMPDRYVYQPVLRSTNLANLTLPCYLIASREDPLTECNSLVTAAEWSADNIDKLRPSTELASNRATSATTLCQGYSRARIISKRMPTPQRL